MIFLEWRIKFALNANSMLIQCSSNTYFILYSKRSIDWGFINLNILIDEQLQPWDNEDEDQFVKDHTGLKDDHANVRMKPIEYHTGLIWEDRENTPEQQMALDELYRSLDRSIPATYDARAKGNVVGLHFYFN